jgi:hypothetical protein
MELRKIYDFFSTTMSHKEFREFTEPNNEVDRVLLPHFVALHSIMTLISKIAVGRKKSRCTETGEEKTTSRWLRAVHANIPKHLGEYYEWPIFIEHEFRRQSPT